MTLWTAAAAPRPGSAPRCTCAFNYSASEPLHVGLDGQHLLHVKLQRSPAGGYLRLARQHLNAAPFPCRTAPGFICKQLIPVTEVVCLLHRRIGGAGELGGRSLTWKMKLETSNAASQGSLQRLWTRFNGLLSSPALPATRTVTSLFPVAAGQQRRPHV